MPFLRHGVSDQWIRDRIGSGAAKLKGSTRDRVQDMKNTGDEHMRRAKAISKGSLRVEGVDGDTGPLSERHHTAMKKRTVAAKASYEAAARIKGGKK